MPRLASLPASFRLAAACFAALVLGFALLAQANLWYQVSGGTPPSADQVLVRYHGDPDRTRLDDVLDPVAHPDADDAHNMWQFLGGDGWNDPTTQTNRTTILTWVRAGAPESGWQSVAPIFTGMGMCGDCHAAGGPKADLPLTTYAHVFPLAQPGGRYPLGPLLISAHNHLFGFAVLALLLSVGVGFTRAPARLRALLILAASGGAALDIAGWFLTRAWGAPFQFMVMLGGGLFGISSVLMALAILHEAALGGRSSAGSAGAAGDGAA
ncbi:MAG: hypothetical protein O2894_05730 [Planctomycetota bacterium]|nr:hypothetical protein [Planctomycetota bacterium]